MSLNGENMGEVGCFGYLGVDIAMNGIKRASASHRVGETAKVQGALRNV